MGVGTSDGKYFDTEFDLLADSVNQYTTKDYKFQTNSERVSQSFRDLQDPVMNYETPLTKAEETQFKDWKQQYAPKDSGADYDLRGAFKSGLTPDAESGHWPDTYKKPNHPTFSDQSVYARHRPDLAGKWEGETYIPPKTNRQRINEGFSDTKDAIEQGTFDPQGSNNLNSAVPDLTEPADIVEKHMSEWMSNLKAMGAKVNNKAFNDWLDAAPISSHIEDRRNDLPDPNLLMQMPMSEVQSTLKEMGEHSPKPIPYKDLKPIPYKIKKMTK